MGEPERTSLSTDSESRFVTLLQVDLVNSTGISNTLSPGDELDLQRAYKSAVETLLNLREVKVEWTGDGALIVFGYPEARLDAAQTAVRTGLNLIEAQSAAPGDIAILSGIEDVHIGDTICSREAPQALKRICIDEPTVGMYFSTNTSPFSGREGKIIQSPKIRARLHKETLRNVGIHVEDDPEGEYFIVKGRGELQLAILIETMRREGYELSVGRPTVIYREVDGVRHEPIEHLFVDCPEEHVGIISEKLSLRKGRMINMVNHGTGRVRVEFSIPSRGLIGYRGEFLSDTRGTGVMNGYLQGYEPYRGDFPSRTTGSLLSDRQGEATAYALFNLEPRGALLITPQTAVYTGMIVGIHNRNNDLNVNVCKGKKLTNMRASGRDDNIILSPIPPISLEMALELIRDDELVEITPKSIRLRKTILDIATREKAENVAKSAANG